MSARIVGLVLAASLIAACGGGGGGKSAEQQQPATPAAQQPTVPADVQLAVAVARAIDAVPAKADSILAANGLTRDGLDSLMYAIASDSAKTAAYSAARRVQ
ncbi:MAG TPA: hypothetical protein VKP10_04430 [Gemmatimonadales bacterium]|nr:hypothetical protein [Gemmatimonadales bacterium]